MQFILSLIPIPLFASVLYMNIFFGKPPSFLETTCAATVSLVCVAVIVYTKSTTKLPLSLGILSATALGVIDGIFIDKGLSVLIGLIVGFVVFLICFLRTPYTHDDDPTLGFGSLMVIAPLLFSSKYTALFVKYYGFSSMITVGWFLFCLSMILFGYIIVWLKIKYQRQIKPVL